MEKDYQKLLAKLLQVNLPPGLEKRVLARIKIEERKRFFVWGSSLAASGIFLVWASAFLMESVKQSGFYQYLSIAFSDFAALKYWKELSFSLTESLPIFGLMAVLGSAAFFVWSVLNLKITHHNYGTIKFA